MSEERLQKHIADWMRGLGEDGKLPAEVELRAKDEVIDSVGIVKDSPFEDYAKDLLDAASGNSLDEGKSRTYQLVAITEATQERWFCNLRIRKRVERSAGDLVQALSKQNAELHAALMRKEAEASRLLLTFAETVGHQNRLLTEENMMHRQKSGEVIDKLESLRSKQLERDMTIEKHKADIEIKDRLTEATIPLLLAIGARLTGNKLLPAPELDDVALHETVKAMSEEQLEGIQNILGDDNGKFNELIDGILTKRTKVSSFRQWVGSLTQEKLMAIVQLLNIGQQAALQERMT